MNNNYVQLSTKELHQCTKFAFKMGLKGFTKNSAINDNYHRNQSQEIYDHLKGKVSEYVTNHWFANQGFKVEQQPSLYVGKQSQYGHGYDGQFSYHGSKPFGVEVKTFNNRLLLTTQRYSTLGKTVKKYRNHQMWLSRREKIGIDNNYLKHHDLNRVIDVDFPDHPLPKVFAHTYVHMGNYKNILGNINNHYYAYLRYRPDFPKAQRGKLLDKLTDPKSIFGNQKPVGTVDGMISNKTLSYCVHHKRGLFHGSHKHPGHEPYLYGKQHSVDSNRYIFYTPHADKKIQQDNRNWGFNHSTQHISMFKPNEVMDNIKKECTQHIRNPFRKKIPVSKSTTAMDKMLNHASNTMKVRQQQIKRVQVHEQQQKQHAQQRTQVATIRPSFS